MCIRKVLHTDSTVDHDKYMERVKELGEEGVVSHSNKGYTIKILVYVLLLIERFWALFVERIRWKFRQFYLR